MERPPAPEQDPPLHLLESVKAQGGGNGGSVLPALAGDVCCPPAQLSWPQASRLRSDTAAVVPRLPAGPAASPVLLRPRCREHTLGSVLLIVLSFIFTCIVLP